MRQKIWLAVIAAIIMTIGLHAENSNIGRSAYPFLKIGISAKAQAMAGAYVGQSDDLNSLYSNPAGLTAPTYEIIGLEQNYDDWGEDDDYIPPTPIETNMVNKSDKPHKIMTSYMNYWMDFQTGFIGYAHYLDEKRALGVSILYQDCHYLSAQQSHGEAY